MGVRETDLRISKMANRLRLTFLRDHLPEVFERVTAAQMTPRDAIAFALQQEVDQREANHFKQALQAAHFPWVKSLDEFDFGAQPSLNPGLIRELAKLEWIDANENVAFFGASGVGKTHLAIALGYMAIQKNYSVRFYEADKLIAALEKAAREGMLESKLKEINRYRLLIIDEIGYVPFSPAAAHIFFDLVSRRYEKKSLMITSNRPPSEWNLVFADQAVTASILDRLLHHCTAMSILGDSYRMREHRRSAAEKGLLPKTNA